MEPIAHNHTDPGCLPSTFNIVLPNGERISVLPEYEDLSIMVTLLIIITVLTPPLPILKTMVILHYHLIIPVVQQ